MPSQHTMPAGVAQKTTNPQPFAQTLTSTDEPESANPLNAAPF
jgi:hypothetical protein